MRGNVYGSGRRRTGSIVLAVGAGLALALAIVLASASMALAKGPPIVLRPPVVVIAVSHAPTVRLPPAAIAHAAGHKIA